jgi:hypothetical protein
VQAASSRELGFVGSPATITVTPASGLPDSQLAARGRHRSSVPAGHTVGPYGELAVVAATVRRDGTFAAD